MSHWDVSSRCTEKVTFPCDGGSQSCTAAATVPMFSAELEAELIYGFPMEQFDFVCVFFVQTAKN